jgi:hypothetical protein
MTSGNSETYGLNNEIYSYDPYNEMLTSDQWTEVRRKDSDYKSRSQDYMRGIQTAPSPEGMALLGRSATGYNCKVFERWQYLDDINSDEPIGYPDYGFTNSSQEFVIMPEAEMITVAQEKRLTHVINKLKPANSICSIINSLSVNTTWRHELSERKPNCNSCNLHTFFRFL